jgi:dihydroflavonol-4-reductase
MTLKEILEVIAAITGLPAPKICLPHNLVLPVAYISEAIALLAKKNDTFITVDGVRMAKKNMFFSTEKAKKTLGYRTRPVTEALRDAINWFRDNGYLVSGSR